MAKLPETKVEKKLSDLKIGESGFTVPWAMWLNLEGECFLNESFTFDEKKGVTVELKITRVQDGYIAFINDNIKYKWTKNSSPNFMGCNEKDCYGKIFGFNEEDELNLKLEIAISEENYELATEIREIIKNKFPK